MMPHIHTFHPGMTRTMRGTRSHQCEGLHLLQLSLVKEENGDTIFELQKSVHYHPINGTEGLDALMESWVELPDIEDGELDCDSEEENGDTEKDAPKNHFGKRVATYAAADY